MLPIILTNKRFSYHYKKASLSYQVHLNNNHVTMYAPRILNGEYYIIEGVNLKKPAHSIWF